jgi:hypothetical protein
VLHTMAPAQGFPLGNFQFDGLPDPLLWVPEVVDSKKSVQTMVLSDALRDLSQQMRLIGTQPDIPDEDEGLQIEDDLITPPRDIKPRRVKGKKEKEEATTNRPTLITCDVPVRCYICDSFSEY